MNGTRTLRSLVSALLVATATLALASCGDDDDGETAKTASELNLYYSLYDRQVAFFRGCVKGVEGEARAQGVNVDVEVSGLDPTKQIQQLENAILQQPDGIIVTAIDATALTPVLEKATEAGIPVVAICDDYGSTHAEDAGPGRLSWIGQSMRRYGTQKAEFIYETLKRQGKLDGAKIAAFYGVRGTPFDVGTRAGMQDVIDRYPEAEFIEGPYAGEYSAPAGLEAAQNVLAAHPDIDALICDQADTCLGAVRAIEEAGIDPNDILVSSGDGNAPELDLIRKGKIDYTTVFCAYDEGAEAVRQLTDLHLNGVAPPEHTTDLGFGVNAPSVDELRSENVDSQTVDADTNAVDQKCDEPRFRVTKQTPAREELEALGIETTEKGN